MFFRSWTLFFTWEAIDKYGAKEMNPYMRKWVVNKKKRKYWVLIEVLIWWALLVFALGWDDLWGKMTAFFMLLMMYVDFMNDLLLYMTIKRAERRGRFCKWKFVKEGIKR